MPEEIWKAVPGYPQYDVSNLGRVRSWLKFGSMKRELLQKPVLKKPTFDGEYLRVGLFNEHGHILASIHRLVLLTFVGDPPPGMEACHNDSNPLNNCLENLRWDTRKSNFVDRENTGHTMKGVRHHFTHFTEQDIQDIRRRAANGEVHRIIAHDYGVTRPTISYIVRRHTWKHV